MNKPVLISGAALFAAGVVAALLWRTPRDGAKGGQEPVAKEQAAPAPAYNESKASTPGPAASAGVQPASPGSYDLAQRRQAGESSESLATFRESLEQRYAGLGKALNLTPDEVNRLLDMQVRFQKELMTGSNDQHTQETELKTMLGPKYTQWEEYNLAAQVRGSVDALQTLFEISDIKPLTQAQAGTLTAALTAEQVRINHDIRNVMSRPQGGDLAVRAKEELEWELRYTPEINRRLALAASPYLDAPQFDAFRKMLEDGMNRQIASMRANLAAREGSSRAAGSAISH